MNNQLYKEPDAGKPHVRICRGVRLVRGVPTRPNDAPESRRAGSA